jgi:hypothetical protein
MVYVPNFKRKLEIAELYEGYVNGKTGYERYADEKYEAETASDIGKYKMQHSLQISVKKAFLQSPV